MSAELCCLTSQSKTLLLLHACHFTPPIEIKICLLSSILHSINLLVKEVFVHHSANVQQGVSHPKEQIWAATPEVKISKTLKSTVRSVSYYKTLLELFLKILRDFSDVHVLQVDFIILLLITALVGSVLNLK